MIHARRILAATLVLVIFPGEAAVAGEINIARRANIAQVTRSFSVNPADFNRDRRDDFFLVRHNPDKGGSIIPFSTLYRRARGGYKNHATKVFGKTDKHDCAWGRANRDRRLDMFCAVGLTQRSVNELWIQKKGGGFVNRARALGLTDGTHGRYRYATFIHANRDKRADIYVTRYSGPCFCRSGDRGDKYPNELWIRTRSSFRRAPKFGLNKNISAKKDNASCAQAVDYDRDGDEDLLVCGEKRLHLYRNRSGRGFRDVTRRKGIGGNAVDARLVYLNRDRRRDLVKLTKKKLIVRYGKRRGRFRARKVIGSPPAPTALAFGRFNPGKTVDIYVVSSRGKRRRDRPDRVFLNRRRRGFRRQLIPRARRGSGDDVAAIYYNRDRRTEFLVTNGNKKTPGPVQLWKWTKRRRR